MVSSASLSILCMCNNCKTEGMTAGSWPMLTQWFLGPSNSLCPSAQWRTEPPSGLRCPCQRLSGPHALRMLRWSWPLEPPATVIYVPVSLSSCELRSHRAAGLGGSSFCFSACLIQTRLTDPRGLGSGSQGARVRGQASRAWKLGVTG